MVKKVPESRRCQRGCCWNPMGTCGRTYTCRCHVSFNSTTAADRMRLEDYLDSLGDE